MLCVRQEMISSLAMIKFINLRDAPYREVLDLQHEIFNQRVELRRKGLDTGEDYIITVTHQPVYTLGRHADPRNVVHREWLEAQGAEVVEIDRGGDVTFHGPGQLVVYPIVDLQRCVLGVKNYVNVLEEAVIRTLAEYGVVSGRVEGATGVWIGVGSSEERKICAIGLRCSRFITMHGLALNIDTDLSWFSAINPCGFIDKGVSTLHREILRGKAIEHSDNISSTNLPSLEEVASALCRHLSELLF